ncbi:Riboflavin biosynthesis protein PYRR, chloroplastic [Linum grandiflorum]
MKRAAELADSSAGFTSPHPNFGCVLITPSGKLAGEGYLYAQGTKPAEVQAVESAGHLSRGATAYLNLEPGDCHGDPAAVSALVQAGVARVVVGVRHPLKHLQGRAVRALRSEGLQVDVLGEDLESKLIEVLVVEIMDSIVVDCFKLVCLI